MFRDFLEAASIDLLSHHLLLVDIPQVVRVLRVALLAYPVNRNRMSVEVELFGILQKDDPVVDLEIVVLGICSTSSAFLATASSCKRVVLPIFSTIRSSKFPIDKIDVTIPMIPGSFFALFFAAEDFDVLGLLLGGDPLPLGGGR